jgi:hypothetical protein
MATVDQSMVFSHLSSFAKNECALNWSLFDLRTYDGRTGRFHNPDPMWRYASPLITSDFALSATFAPVDEDGLASCFESALQRKD